MESVLALWHVSAVSSEVVCTIFWWAGLQGDVPRLAGGRSGNYKRHLDTCLGHAKGRQLHCLLPVPGHKRHELTRTVHDVPTMPMHEVLAKELRDSATVPFKLEEARENGTLPRAYWDHPVVKASSTPVLPVAVFMDGAAYSHTDSVLGVWAINMISQKRHVVALMRKRQMCKHGCQGWCSQFPLMTLLRWSLEAVAHGRYVWGASRHFWAIL